MSFDIPVLLLTWRRPETTRQVIEAIRPVAPGRLYVASDGPRNAAEARAVDATRALMTQLVDWPCQIKTRYSATNQGCQLGVSAAITWFFEHEQAGIVLEDDCVPHPDFFSYCHELLMRYWDDSRVWCISGDNFQAGVWRGEGSYYFSRYNHCWGWATWRRCWTHYASHAQIWEQLRASPSLQQAMFEDPLERRYWMQIWQRLFVDGVPDSWAYRWSLVCMANSGLTALPNQNLVINIGFGEDATHTVSGQAQEQSAGLPEIYGPNLVCRDALADQWTFYDHFGGAHLRREQHVVYRFKRCLKSVLKAVIGGLKS